MFGPYIGIPDVNVQGARNACDEARGAGVRRIIFTGPWLFSAFAPPDTDENGSRLIILTNMGKRSSRQKKIYKQWQAEDPVNRFS